MDSFAFADPCIFIGLHVFYRVLLAVSLMDVYGLLSLVVAPITFSLTYSDVPPRTLEF